MILVDDPPMASASDVLGSRFENVAGSEAWTGAPFSSTKRRRRRFGVEAKTSEWISPRREMFSPEAPVACDLDERTKRPLLLLGKTFCCDVSRLAALVGLELEA